MLIAQIMASPFFGGPERQVLGLAESLPADYETLFVSLPERGLARDFLDRAAKAGFRSVELHHNWPRWRRAVDEIVSVLKSHQVDVICTNGYKPDVLGWLAARRLGIPCVAIAHGWTAANWRARCYEQFDRWVMRRFDAVVAVSQAQAAKVRAAKVSTARIETIPNAIQVVEPVSAEAGRRQELRSELEAYVPGVAGPRDERKIAVAAGRLSPEKGFDLLIDAFADFAADRPACGLVIFGAGPLRDALQQQIDSLNLQGRVALGGFRENLIEWLSAADWLVISSHTEGLPVVLLEAMAVSLPVVATNVGGIPEVIRDGVEGYLVPAGRRAELAAAMRRITAEPQVLRALGAAGRERVETAFSCAGQADRYRRLFDRLAGTRKCSRSDQYVVRM